MLGRDVQDARAVDRRSRADGQPRDRGLDKPMTNLRSALRTEDVAMPEGQKPPSAPAADVARAAARKREQEVSIEVVAENANGPAMAQPVEQ